MRPLLGCFVEVGARGAAAGAGIDAAFDALQQAQAWWSFHDADSELSRLNRAPQTRVPVHSHTRRLLRAARAMMRASQGAFDCTVDGALVRAGVLPDHGGPVALARGVADDIVLGHDWACLRRPLRLTLDGIAKGYAVDLAIHALRRHGVAAGWVSAGGDLRVSGDMALPLQRRELDGSLSSLGSLRNAALATSHTAAQNDPAFPSRIISATGQAPEPGVWSVLAGSAWRADALTKVAAATAAAQRQALVRALGGCLLTDTGVVI